MFKRLQRGAIDHTQPLWQRMLVIASLLLVTFASSAQAAHIHGQWLPHHDSQLSSQADLSQAPGGEEHCPLCVAMHSTMPVPARMPVISIVLVQHVRPAELADRTPDSLWHYARFSRPPPALETL